MSQRKKMNMKIIDLQVSWMTIFVYKINSLTLKLGHLWIYDSEEVIEKKNYKLDNDEWIEV